MTDKINKSESEIKEIITEFYDDIYKYCYWKTKNSVDAQDITQETFMRFIKNFNNYIDMGKQKALLYTIAKTLCIYWTRKNSYIPLEEINTQNLFFVSNEQDNVIDKLYLQDAISKLQISSQEVLLLRYGQGLKVSEIANILNISRFSVMYRLKCAINKLSKMNIGDD